jgi:uncharacterized RDD family membrane protein YckC
MQYAGFWVRFWAQAIDSLIWTPLLILVYLKFTLDAILMGAGESLAFLYFLLSVLTPWLYSALFEAGKWQATPGKRILGVYVTDMNGRRISFGRATERYFSKFFSSLIFGIGYIIAGLTQNKQALHDKIANTLVFHGKPEEDLDEVRPLVSPQLSTTSEPVSNWVFAGFGAEGDLVRITFSSDDSRLSTTGLVVGRSFDSCDLYIKDASVSRRHARFIKAGSKILLEDLGSTNGVSINGRQIRRNSSIEVPAQGDLTIGGVELTIGKY